MKEEYYAPLGMSSVDFNSLIRKRHPSHLTHQLIEQGRVNPPGSSDAPNNTAHPAEIESGVANTPEPSLTEVAKIAPPPRAASSIYSRDIDGRSFCSSTPILTPSSGNTSCESLSPASIPLPLSKNSSMASISSFAQAAASSAMSAGIHKMSSDTAAAGKKRGSTRGLHSLIKEKMRVSSPKARSLIALSGANNRVVPSNHEPGQPKLYERAHATAMQPSKEPSLDLRTAIAALLQRHEQRNKPQELIPPVDQIFELGRLRRAIRRLNFDAGNMIMLASDLTTLVPMPTLRKTEAMPGMDRVEDIQGNQSFFRDRLARTVHRQIILLKLEAQDGHAREIELWYRDVVDLVGWRDEEEARQPWSWREKEVFF